MKIIYLLLSILIVSCQKQSPTKSPATSTNTPKTNEKTIIVALEENVQWGYYQFIKDGKFKGLEIDLLKHIDDKSDYQFEYKTMPWKRAMAEIKKGNIDLLISATSSSVRDLDFDYTCKLYEINQVLYFEKSRFPEGLKVTKQSELSDLKIGAVTAYNTDALKFKISDPHYRTFNDMFKAMNRGWIDCSISYLELDAFNQNKSEFIDYIKIPNHKPLNCHWLVSKQNPRKEAILKELNKHLLQLKKDGTYKKLEQPYLSQN